jgi:uncharacterized membrane protein
VVSPLPGESRAFDINDEGWVVGVHEPRSSAHRCFLWNFHTGALATWNDGAASCDVYGINHWGAMAGDLGSASGVRSALWPNVGSTPLNLGDLGNPNAVAAYALADDPVVVGVAGPAESTGSFVSLGFIWIDGVMRNMGTLGGMDTRPYAVVTTGTWPDPTESSIYAVGESAAVYDGPPHAFLYHQNSMYDLKRLPGHDAGVAKHINRQLLIVGNTYNTASTGSKKAVLWKGKVPYDLNLFIADPEWWLSGAEGISDSGFIAGYGMYESQWQAFLLVP